MKLGSAGLQVSSISRSRPSLASSQSHSGWVRWSHQMQRGAQDFSRCVEQDAAVHLAGQSHGLDLCAIQFGGSNRARDGLARGAPPVLGLLLRPADLFGADRRVLTGRRRHHAALAVHQHGPRSPRPNIDSQKHRAVAPSIPSLADSISIASKVYPLRRGGCMRAAGNLHCQSSLRKHVGEVSYCDEQRMRPSFSNGPSTGNIEAMMQWNAVPPGWRALAAGGIDFPAACRRRLRPRASGQHRGHIFRRSAGHPGALQQLSAPGGVNLATPTQGTFGGSLVAGKATDAVLDLSLDDAIARGLRQNLGLILQASAQQSAHGQQMEQLQALLPTVTGDASIEVEQIDLAAFGLKIPGLNPIIGPFQVVDFRAYLTQSLINVPALESYIAAKHNFAAAKLTAEDAREMVVLTVGNAYLLCLADAARITAVNAELATSKLSLDQATASHDAGVSPRLDVLRAQVDYQNEQQALISTTNQLAKDKLALARAIGLPLDQAYPPHRQRSPTPRWTTWIPQLRLRRR